MKEKRRGYRILCLKGDTRRLSLGSVNSSLSFLSSPAIPITPVRDIYSDIVSLLSRSAMRMRALPQWCRMKTVGATLFTVHSISQRYLKWMDELHMVHL